MNNETIKVGIMGAASYAAGELLKMLFNHPNVEVVLLVSETYNDAEVVRSHAFLKSVTDLAFTVIKDPTDLDELEQVIGPCDVVFMSKPHSYAAKYAQNIIKLVEDGLVHTKIIDLSGDFRLKDVDQFEHYYNVKHDSPSLLDSFVYGLPELNREKIANSNYIANPGCYPTSILLGLAPIMKEPNILGDGAIIIDSISGVSGAGKKPNEGTMFINVTENLRPYKIGVHQHTPEIEQELSTLHGSSVQVLFSPYVGAFKCGIKSTIYVPLKKGSNTSWKYYNDLYSKFYGDEPFIRLANEGEFPEITNVVGSNFCDIGFAIDKRTDHLVVISTIDNTIKGAAGQALQNFNLMFGLNETLGLPYSGMLKKKSVDLADKVPLRLIS